MGKWEIKSWVNLKNNTDKMKDSDAPMFKVNFMKDTVNIIEESDNYSFTWKLRNDTLEIQSLGNFYIDYLNDKKLILIIKTFNIFSKQKELHKEEITLIKRKI